TQPSWTPAKFSIALGSGTESSSPLPFCVTCDNMTLSYQHTQSNRPGADLHATSPPLGPMDAYGQNAGRLPLNAVVGSSSAFLGVLLQVGFGDGATSKLLVGALLWAVDQVFTLPPDLRNAVEKSLNSLLTSDVALWGTSKTDGSAFSEGLSLRQSLVSQNGSATQPLLDQMAQVSLHALADGAVTDNTGIAHAVSAGAATLVAFMDSYDLWGLFAGFSPKTHNPVTCPDDPITGVLCPKDFCPLCTLKFQIFSQAYQVAQANFERTAWNLKVADSSAKFLPNIRVGTINATTIENRAFGIAAGQAITLHVVFVDSPLSMGGYSYQDYARLVQAIVDTARNEVNREPVKQILQWLGHLQPESGHPAEPERKKPCHRH
ncbi:unnamed protein product, partial [Polarella glacialis]